ncbi:MAG: hypothetical protein ABIR96_11875 [Bdellovibrionota bacterium]
MRKRLLIRHLVVASAVAGLPWQAQADMGALDKMFLQLGNPATSRFNPSDYSDIIEQEAKVKASDFQMVLRSRGMNAAFVQNIWDLPASEIVAMNFTTNRQELASDKVVSQFGMASPNKTAHFRQMLQALRGKLAKQGKKFALSDADIEKVAGLLSKGQSVDGQMAIDPALLANVQANADNLEKASSPEEREQVLASFNDSLGVLAGQTSGETAALLGSTHGALTDSFSSGSGGGDVLASNDAGSNSDNALFSLNNGDLFKGLDMNNVQAESRVDEDTLSGTKSNSGKLPSNSWLKPGDVDRLLESQAANSSATSRPVYANIAPQVKISNDSGVGGVGPVASGSSVFDKGSAGSRSGSSNTATGSSHDGGNSEASIKQRLNAITSEVSQGRNEAGVNPSAHEASAASSPADKTLANAPAAESVSPQAKSDAKMKDWLIDNSARLEANNMGLTGDAYNKYVDDYKTKIASRTQSVDLSTKSTADKKLADWLVEDNARLQADSMGLAGPAYQAFTKDYAQGIRYKAGDKSALLTQEQIHSHAEATADGMGLTGVAREHLVKDFETKIKASQETTSCKETRVQAFTIMATDHIQKFDLAGRKIGETDYNANLDRRSIIPLISTVEVSKTAEQRSAAITKFASTMGEALNATMPADWCPEIEENDQGKSRLKDFDKHYADFTAAFSRAALAMYQKQQGPELFRNDSCPRLETTHALETHRLFITKLIAIEVRARNLVPADLKEPEVACSAAPFPQLPEFRNSPIVAALTKCSAYDLTQIADLVAAQGNFPRENCLDNKITLAFLKSLRDNKPSESMQLSRGQFQKEHSQPNHLDQPIKLGLEAQ